MGYILHVHSEAAQRKGLQRGGHLKKKNNSNMRMTEQTLRWLHSKLVYQINVSQFLHKQWSQVVIAPQFLLVQEVTLAHRHPVMSHTEVFIFLTLQPPFFYWLKLAPFSFFFFYPFEECGSVWSYFDWLKMLHVRSFQDGCMRVQQSISSAR